MKRDYDKKFVGQIRRVDNASELDRKRLEEIETGLKRERYSDLEIEFDMNLSYIYQCHRTCETEALYLGRLNNWVFDEDFYSSVIRYDMLREAKRMIDEKDFERNRYKYFDKVSRYFF